MGSHPSSIARLYRSVLVGAGRPATMYLVRIRSTYSLTVSVDKLIDLATAVVDAPAAYNSSTRRCWGERSTKPGSESRAAAQSMVGTATPPAAACRTASTNSSSVTFLRRTPSTPALAAICTRYGSSPEV